MSDHSKDNVFDPGAWFEFQRQFLDTLLAPGRKSMDSTVHRSSGNPMTDYMNQWWKLVSPSLPEGGTELYSKLLEQGQLYSFMAEQLSTLLNNIGMAGKISEDWQKNLDQQFDELKKLFTSGNPETSKVMHNMMGAWQLLPMDTLQRTLSSASVMPGDFLEDFKPHDLDKVTDKFLSIPGVGYTREHQEQVQAGIKLWNEYQKTYQEYNNAMSLTGIHALEKMRLKILEMYKQGEEINSLREIYDLWVDCNEDAYADYVYSDEFSELYGRLTNALMALKQHGRNIVDEILGALNMPTRRSMSTMQVRQQELRRDYKHTTRKIESLEREIEKLKAGKNSGRESSPGKKKKADVRKRTRKVKKEKTKMPAQARKKTVRRKAAPGKKAGNKPADSRDKIVIKI